MPVRSALCLLQYGIEHLADELLLCLRQLADKENQLFRMDWKIMVTTILEMQKITTIGRMELTNFICRVNSRWVAKLCKELITSKLSKLCMVNFQRVG